MQYVSAILREAGYQSRTCMLELEAQLKQYLGTPFLNFVSNGTIALQLALRTLDILDGESSPLPSPMWHRFFNSVGTMQACFVDIELNTFVSTPGKIEAAITPNTKAIMAFMFMAIL